MLNPGLHDIPLVFLDLETTGLDVFGEDRICEVALQRVTNGVIEATLDSLVDPRRPLSIQSFRVNGIEPELLAGAPIFDDLADDIMAALDGAVLVAHNAPFDVGFLTSELARIGRPPPRNPVLDTLALARRLLVRRRSYSLAALAADLAVPQPTHRAMADVFALRAVFEDLMGRLGPLAVATLEQLLRYTRGFAPGESEPLLPPLIADALLHGQLLRIVYASRSSPEPTERVIRPWELTNERGVLYLRAYCYLRNDLRTFAITKILHMERTEQQ